MEDCIATVRHLVKIGISDEGKGKQFLIGGSHGGFLNAHRVSFDIFFRHSCVECHINTQLSANSPRSSAQPLSAIPLSRRTRCRVTSQTGYVLNSCALAVLELTSAVVLQRVGHRLPHLLLLRRFSRSDRERPHFSPPPAQNARPITAHILFLPNCIRRCRHNTCPPSSQRCGPAGDADARVGVLPRAEGQAARSGYLDVSVRERGAFAGWRGSE